MQVKTVKIEISEDRRRVVARDQEKTLYYEGELPPDIGLRMGHKRVAYFHAHISTRHELVLGREIPPETW